MKPYLLRGAHSHTRTGRNLIARKNCERKTTESVKFDIRKLFSIIHDILLRSVLCIDTNF